MTMLDPNTPGYERWMAAARAIDPERWASSSSPEMREPWILEARQKELDDAERVSLSRAAVGGFDPLIPGVIPPVVCKPGVPCDGMGQPEVKVHTFYR
jgi:hypothetical protein